MTNQITMTIAWTFFSALLDVSFSGEPVYLTANTPPSTARQLTVVPGLNFSLPVSHAGFITVSETPRNHLFFWFFPQDSDPSSPLVVWLNGGPTVSSMTGLLWENGPIRIKKLEDGAVTYTEWSESWTGPFSMLYIDNPVGTGFSYTEDKVNGYRLSEEDYANDLCTFLELFTTFFPQYLQRQLYIGGQSYAGKYVTALAHKIHTKIVSGKSQLRLTGIYLGGPMFDMFVQFTAFSRLFYSVGFMTNSQTTEHVRHLSGIQDELRKGKLNTSSNGELLQRFYQKYIFNNFDTFENSPHEDIKTLMQSSAMREALHVGNLDFKPFNPEVYDKFGADLIVSTLDKLVVLMDNYKVLLYNGNYDAIINTAMIEAAIMSVSWSHQAAYNISSRNQWHIENKLSGFYTHVAQFCRVVVLRAGHNTPNDQPKATLEMMKQFIRNGCVQ